MNSKASTLAVPVGAAPDTLLAEAAQHLSLAVAGRAGLIYQARVMHQRLETAGHSFEYPVWYAAVDLDRLADLARGSRLLGYNRPAVFSLWDADYLDGEGSLRQKVDRHLDEHGLVAQRVVLLTVPRSLGRVFNPVSFYYCYSPDDHLLACLSEVNNTFGERHVYFLDQPQTTGSKQMVGFRAAKAFHVSPFFDRQGDYDFRFSEPGARLDVSIDLMKSGVSVLRTRLWGEASPLDDKGLAKVLLVKPFSAALTYPRILWQAAKLYWGKKLPVHTKPYADSPDTLVAEPSGRWRGWQRDLVLRYFRRLRKGSLTLTLPDRSVQVFGGQEPGPQAAMTVGNWTFFRRVLLSGDIGLGESYQEGEWASPSLPQVLRFFGTNLSVADDRQGMLTAALGRWVERWRHLRHANTLLGSRRNIAAHYDLSNELYAQFLGETWTYSCACFREPGQAEAEGLAPAQRRKIEQLLQPLKLQPGQRLLEIGSGWGELAIVAARDHGVLVHSITLSQEQLALARQRAEQAGVADRIQFEILDYRQLEGQYDAVVSCEMLEAVGHENLGAYFAAVDAVLKPGGRASVQVITLPDHRYAAYRRGTDWIQKHIFPGAVCPSLAAMTEALAGHSRLMVARLDDIGPHYAATLRLWRAAFLGRAAAIRGLGFDERFIRTWDYYFSYCEAGFAERLLGDLQLLLERSGDPR